MNRTAIVEMIDEALERYAARERVAGSEIVDFLLDLRSVVVSDDEIEALLEAESQPTA